jgi:hypothetical protein
VTIYKPFKLFLLFAAIDAALIYGISLMVSDGWTILFAAFALWGLFAVMTVVLIWTDGEPPPPTPVSRHLPVRRSKIYDVDSRVSS